MLKKSILLFSVVLAITIAASSTVFSFTNGGSPSCSGSPTDGANCATSCHNTSVNQEKPGWIVSDIPESGYIPDSTYTITATATGIESSKKFGFEASPQLETGKIAGKIILTNANETKLIAGGKCITQKEAGTDGTTSKSWSFKWIAPAKGTGNLTFYAAFLIGGKPEIAVTSKLNVTETK